MDEPEPPIDRLSIILFLQSFSVIVDLLSDKQIAKNSISPEARTLKEGLRTMIESEKV